ncbi:MULTISPECIES: hypothetical protein [Marinobacter]|uniref:hypothetical protein n=1 Tax=Marinobacter TaxID=2742 RepID=UPI00294275DD|nr:hypothetical protein [Marinobacter salarius]WOI18783.1 hypothetical protein R1T46_18790 [Marinobacter salarius]
MRQIQTDVWETDVESPFPGLTTHAYLLTRDDGNVLFYNTGHHHEIDRMAELGGVAHRKRVETAGVDYSSTTVSNPP